MHPGPGFARAERCCPGRSTRASCKPPGCTGLAGTGPLPGMTGAVLPRPVIPAPRTFGEAGSRPGQDRVPDDSCGTAATKFTAGRTRAAHTPLGYGPVVKAALEDQWQRRCTDRRGARLRAPAARHATRSLEADEQLPVRRDRASGIEDPIQPLRMQGFRSSPGWTRTNNPPVNSRMLCQLSYRGPTAKRRSQSSRCPELL